MNNQLLSDIDKFNPVWSQYIKAYLKGDLKELPYDPEVDERANMYVDINDISHCVVGETHGFRSEYHFGTYLGDPNTSYCKKCDDFGNALCDYSDHHPVKFRNILTKLYEHLQEVHGR